MKYKVFLLVIAFFIFYCPVYADEIKINSETAVLYNLNENKILFSKNKDKKVSIASLTKMMTAIVAIENIDNLEEKVSFIKSDYNKLIELDASGSSFDVKKKYTYYDLLNGLILESGADCAYALARLTSGSNEDFVSLMNAKAKEIGMNNSSFANPVGLDDKNNYSTMDDMAKLFKYGLKNETFEKIITSFKYTATDGTTIHHTLNFYAGAFDLKLPYLKGGKTGYETTSGYALATIAEENGVKLMFITSRAFDIPDHVKDAKRIYEYYFKNYGYQKLVNKGDILATLKTKDLKEETVNVRAVKDVYYYLPNNYDKKLLIIKYNGIQTVKPSYKKGDILGQVSIYYNNELVEKIDAELYQDVHFSIPKFILNNKMYLITSCITYLVIIVATIITIKRINKQKAST